MRQRGQNRAANSQLVWPRCATRRVTSLSAAAPDACAPQARTLSRQLLPYTFPAVEQTGLFSLPHEQAVAGFLAAPVLLPPLPAPPEPSAVPALGGRQSCRRRHRKCQPPLHTALHSPSLPCTPNAQLSCDTAAARPTVASHTSVGAAGRLGRQVGGQAAGRHEGRQAGGRQAGGRALRQQHFNASNRAGGHPMPAAHAQAGGKAAGGRLIAPAPLQCMCCRKCCRPCRIQVDAWCGSRTLASLGALVPVLCTWWRNQRRPRVLCPDRQSSSCPFGTAAGQPRQMWEQADFRVERDGASHQWWHAAHLSV